MEKMISWRENGKTITGTEYEFHLAGIPDKALLQEMDEMTADKTDPHYKSLRAEMEKRMKQTTNPFRAGRPSKYSTADYEKVRKLREEGKSIRSISQETGVSATKVSEMIRGVQK